MLQQNILTPHDLRLIADDALHGVAEGEPLDSLAIAFVELGVASSVTSLDPAAIDRAIASAFAAGATVQQIQEVVSLISGLGVHSLMIAAPMILAQAPDTGAARRPLDRDQQALWDHHVGTDPFWADFERELPGFLEAMLRLSNDQFVAFFDYCAVPWRSGTVRAQLKELIAMASDATPTHRFLPGFRIHLRNAVALGAGRAAVMGALDIAAAAPAHTGTR